MESGKNMNFDNDNIRDGKQDPFMTKTIVVWAGALLCCALWGSAFPCIKIGYKIMGIEASDTASQILYAGIRFTLAGILAIILGSLLARKFLYPKRQAYAKVAWLSMLQTVLQYFFFYVGLAHTSGVKASIIEGMNVFVAIVVAALIFGQEKITFQKMLGCIIGFAGVVLVNLQGGVMDISFSFLGEGFIFLSTVAYAFSSVYLKKFSQTENTVMLSGYQFVFGGIVMSIVGLFMGGHFEGNITVEGILMICWLAFVSAVAYSLWGILLTYNPVSRVAVFGFMNPVFGVVLSAVLLGESEALGLICLGSLVLVCVGIFIVNKGESNKGESNKGESNKGESD